MRAFLTVAALAIASGGCPVASAAVSGECKAGICTFTLTAAQLLANAERLVLQHRFEAARPMIAALSDIAGYGMQTHFLIGYMAVESGDLETAIDNFRAALAIEPKATRIRLELARAMMMKGNREGADYNLRLAEQDPNLPPEIIATVRASRGLLRDKRTWHLTTDFGLAPDTNITNGTTAQTIDLTYGNQTVPVTLNGNARARSGVGQTGAISAGWRHLVSEGAALLVDFDGQGVNYRGKASDDFTAQVATGPEFRTSERAHLSVQGIGSQRWYGGVRAATQLGVRGAFQRDIGSAERAGLTIDVRHTDSGFSREYNGWTGGAYFSYERVVVRSMIASASVFARTEQLVGKAYSNGEVGFNLGIGGELGHGLNAGVSAGLSRARYEAPLLAFSPDPRHDVRFNARVYAGLRSVRILGFSPSVSYSFARNNSSMTLYDTKRSRLSFNLARYF